MNNTFRWQLYLTILLMLCMSGIVLAQENYRRDAAGDYLQGLPKVAQAKANGYMTEQELAVVDILNSIRRNPQAAAAFLSRKYAASMSENESSLYHTLLQMLPDTSYLVCDKALFESAACHAQSAGLVGYRGHERLKSSGCTTYFFGECISFGLSKPMDIVLQLLIDEGVPNLGHRKICLRADFHTIGIAIRPHKIYQYNSVLDFGF